MPATKRKATSTQTIIKRVKYTPPTSRRAVMLRNRMVSSVSAVPRPLMGFPHQRKVTMRYASWQDDWASTSGALNQQVVSMNDLNDPDTTGVGHQPLGYDQWRLFYEDYIVTEARLSVQVVLASQAITSPPIVGVLMHDSNSVTATSHDALVEQGRSTWKLLPPSITPGPHKFYMKADLKKVFNVADVKDNKHRFGGTFGGSPNEENYFIIWLQTLDQATTTTVDLYYVVEYDVIVSSPKELAQS